MRALPAAIFLLSALVQPCVDGGEIDFNNDVRPILSNKCLLCHGPDPEGLQAGLRLDKADGATSKLDSGMTAVVPGKPAQSELIARITSDDEDLRMPPADHGAKLNSAEVDVLRQWIEEGAEYATHWAYTKPVRPETPDPATEHASWVRNAVDHFTLKQMMSHGLKPSQEADRYALIRRVYLDLTGLPPSLEAADEFVNDDAPDAYEKVVNRLLQSPAFGEHWARKWLDLARYADSAGYADDPPRTIWAYRDWVIRAFNDNMPFDQFTIEQMAGDLLPNASQDQLIATAFHRNTLTNNEGGTQDEEFRNVAVVDRVNTTMAVWMGTTMACAQCHTHKYDPITQDEYFQFFAILNNTQDADRRDESPRLEIYTDDQTQRKAELQSQIDSLTKVIQTSTPQLVESQNKWEQRLSAVPEWTPRIPATVSRKSGKRLTIDDTGAILAADATDTDTYTVNIPLNHGGEQDSFAAIRISTLPHPSLPSKGSGLGGGNFVVTSVKAQIVPDGDTGPTARFVRVTNNGKGQILSLAEVEVFSNGNNVAMQGKASQHSTAYEGPPQYAIDGNTDGDYQRKSVTHTETVDNPWWEVDLGSVQSLERIAIWNRTDNNLQSRLNNFTIELLDEDREVVWTSTVKDAPKPSVELSPSNIRDVKLVSAFSDFHQQGFEPTDVLSGKTGNTDGWAVGGQTTTEHQLILVPAKSVEVKSPASLRLIVEQNSKHKKHLLGHFRVSTTLDQGAIERSRLPQTLLATLDKAKESRSDAEAATLATHYRLEIAPELKNERTSLDKATTSLAAMKPGTSVPILREMEKPRETRLQFRGNYLDKGHVLNPGLPAVFQSTPKSDQLNRLAMAEWLVSADNPLTARVLANRYWETVFGRGIVVTSEEFGSQGEPPTHPALLDWLATEIIRTGWDRKQLLKLLVTSATYRQSARATSQSVADDPDNRWLSRGPRIRLSAEMIRDQTLFASGLLSSKMYGPPVKPPQPSLGLKAAFGSSTDWKTSQGEDRYRRGLYTTWRRSNPYPSMATFDAPNREVCTVRRNRTNTPLQSLVTLNDPVYVETAQSLARIALQHADNPAEQISHAFRRCVIRPVHPAELTALVELFTDSHKQLSGTPDEAMQLATVPLGTLPEGMEATDAAAMTVVCNVLLNLDEMFLKR